MSYAVQSEKPVKPVLQYPGGLPEDNLKSLNSSAVCIPYLTHLAGLVHVLV